MNIFSKVGRNVHLTPTTKAKMIGIVIGMAMVTVFVLIKMVISGICTFGKTSHELRFNMYCTEYTEENLPKNCIIDQFYMNK